MLLVLSVLAGPAARAAQYLQVFVTAPYLELHTGPGRGYPVFNVVDRDASVDVLKRFTDWFKVRTASGVEGWVAAQDMEQTVLADGTHFHYDVGDLSAYTSHRFEAGAFLKIIEIQLLAFVPHAEERIRGDRRVCVTVG